MSLSTALARLQAIIEGDDSAWRRNGQRLTSLSDAERVKAGIDKTFWITADKLGGPDGITGDQNTYTVQVTIEWARTWLKGDRLDRDFQGLIRAFEDDIRPALDSMAYQPNWKKSTSGIILVQPFEVEIAPGAEPADQVLLLVTTSEMKYRSSSQHATVT